MSRARIVRQVNPIFKIRVRNIFSASDNPADYELLKRGTVFYVTDDSRLVRLDNSVPVPQRPRDENLRWCWQFKIGNGGRLTYVPDGTPGYNVICTNWMWSGSTYNFFIKNYMYIINEWQRLSDLGIRNLNQLENELVGSTIVDPIRWEDDIKNAPELNFEPVYITGALNQIVYLKPNRQRQIWEIKLDGFERWQRDPVFQVTGGFLGLGQTPIRNIPNYVQLNFAIELEVHLVRDSRNNGEMVCQFAVIKQIRINHVDNINRQYYQDMARPFDRVEVTGINNYTPTERTTIPGYVFDPPDVYAQQSIYWRPNSANLLYVLKGTSDYYWINTRAHNRVNIDDTQCNHRFFRVDWSDVHQRINPVEMAMVWQSGRPASMTSIFFRELADHNLFFKEDGSEMELKFNRIWNVDSYYHENIINQYRNNLNQLINLSYVYKIRRIFNGI